MKPSINSCATLVMAILSIVTWPAEALAADSLGAMDLCLALPDKAFRHQDDPKSVLLAANDVQPGLTEAGHRSESNAPEWHEPWLTGNKAHEYMGLGSLILAGLTVVTAPNSEGTNGTKNDSTHRALANGALALGLGAVTTGFIYHFDDIHWDNGITDPDNLHMMLGLLGTAGYAIAVANGGKGGHSTAGIVGAASMVGAIKLEW